MQMCGAFEIAEWTLVEPRQSEVLVRVVANGICQTELHVRDPHYPGPLPAVLGHAGAGVVERVGAGVRGLVSGVLDDLVHVAFVAAAPTRRPADT